MDGDVLDLSVRSSVCLSVVRLLPSCQRMNWYQCKLTRVVPVSNSWTVDVGVGRLKVKVTVAWNQIWKPGGDITLDPLSRVERSTINDGNVAVERPRGVAFSFNCGCASCSRTCFFICWIFFTISIVNWTLVTLLLQQRDVRLKVSISLNGWQ